MQALLTLCPHTPGTLSPVALYWDYLVILPCFLPMLLMRRFALIFGTFCIMVSLLKPLALDSLTSPRGLLSLFAWSCSLGNTPVRSSPPCLNPSLCGWKFPETHCHADRDHCHFMTPRCGGWGDPAVTVPVGSAHFPASRLCCSPTSFSSLLADGLASRCTEALKHLGERSAHCLRPSGLPTPFPPLSVPAVCSHVSW